MALYSDVIRERFRQPRFRGRLDAPDAVFEDVNPLCGDRIRIEGRLRDGPPGRRAVSPAIAARSPRRRPTCCSSSALGRTVDESRRSASAISSSGSRPTSGHRG